LALVLDEVDEIAAKETRSTEPDHDQGFPRSDAVSDRFPRSLGDFQGFRPWRTCGAFYFAFDGDSQEDGV